jgi:hypothetical protein
MISVPIATEFSHVLSWPNFTCLGSLFVWVLNKNSSFYFAWIFSSLLISSLLFQIRDWRCNVSIHSVLPQNPPTSSLCPCSALFFESLWPRNILIHSNINYATSKNYCHCRLELDLHRHTVHGHNKPVLIYIHGGLLCNMCGNNNRSFIPYLVPAKKWIVVCVNYGFLRCPSISHPADWRKRINIQGKKA